MATIALTRRSTSSFLRPDLVTRLSRAAECAEADGNRFVERAGHMLQCAGYHMLGRGVYGLACLSPDGSAVVKVYGADTGYRAYLDVVAEFRRNPYLPRIYERFDLDKTSGVVVMEPLPRTLLQVSEEPTMRRSRTVAVYWKARQYYYGLVNRFDAQVPPRGLPSVRLPARLKAVIDRCAEIIGSSGGAVWADFHRNNAMVRADGTLVLTDPMAGR